MKGAAAVKGAGIKVVFCLCSEGGGGARVVLKGQHSADIREAGYKVVLRGRVSGCH